MVTKIHFIAIFLVLFSSFLVGCQRETKQPSPPPLVEGKFQGALDGYHQGEIVGWVYDQNRKDESVTVEVYEGDQLLGETVADKLRKDLAEKNIGTGRYGFGFPVPKRMRDGNIHEIRAKIKNSSFELKNSPKKVTIK